MLSPGRRCSKTLTAHPRSMRSILHFLHAALSPAPHCRPCGGEPRCSLTPPSSTSRNVTRAPSCRPLPLRRPRLSPISAGAGQSSLRPPPDRRRPLCRGADEGSSSDSTPCAGPTAPTLVNVGEGVRPIHEQDQKWPCQLLTTQRTSSPGWKRKWTRPTSASVPGCGGLSIPGAPTPRRPPIFFESVCPELASHVPCFTQHCE